MVSRTGTKLEVLGVFVFRRLDNRGTFFDREDDLSEMADRNPGTTSHRPLEWRSVQCLSIGVERAPSGLETQDRPRSSGLSLPHSHPSSVRTRTPGFLHSQSRSYWYPFRRGRGRKVLPFRRE